MLVNYSQLKAHYDAVTPIRGDVNKTKPFFDRRRKHEHMVMKDNGDIQIICYDTPVFTVHPDSSFSLRHGGYVTQTTANFMNYAFRTLRWLGRGGVYKHKNNLWLRQSDVSHKNVIFPILKDPIRLVYDESSDTYKSEEVVTYTEQRLRVDKDKSKQARTECKKFLTWLKAIVSVMEGSKVQGMPPKSPQEGHIRHLCGYPSGIKLRSHDIQHMKAAAELKHMLTCDDDAKFLELLHHVAHGGVVNKKTVCAKVNKIINRVFDVYHVDQVEIKAGSGKT
jgi:hypothetical protein